jgi:hypothetical protein
MFILDQSDSYFWPVKVKVPSDNGRFTELTFDCKFKRVTESEFKAYLEKVQNKEMNDHDICKEIIVDWRGILNQDKTELKFSQESLSRVLDVNLVAKSIAMSWLDSVTGEKTKN